MSRDGCDETEQCVSCGAEFTGQFCGDCGEKVIDRKDYSILAFLREAFEAITTIDNKVFRSLKYLLIKPGFLTQEYFIGRRKRYLKPIQLFLLVNIAFFVFFTAVGLNPFAQPLDMVLKYDNTFFPKLAKRMVNAKIQKEGIDKETYAQKFNARTSVISKTLLIVDIPLYAVLLLLFFRRQRRFYVQHLAFSCHVFTVYLIMAMVIIGVCLLLVKTTGNRIFASDMVMTAPVVLLFLVFLILSAKRFYQQRLLTVLLKSLFLIVGFVAITTQIYRTILFFVTFYTI